MLGFILNILFYILKGKWLRRSNSDDGSDGGVEETTACASAKKKRRIEDLCNAVKNELLLHVDQSAELLDFAESQVNVLQETIKQAKAKRIQDELATKARKDLPNKLPVELVHLVATSGFLSTKDLGRFLLRTDKTIPIEFKPDFVWKTILQSHFKRPHIAESYLQPMVKAKGYEWVFRQLHRETELARVSVNEIWEAPSTTLTSDNLKIVVSFRYKTDSTDLFTTELTKEQLELLESQGSTEIPFLKAVADEIRKDMDPPVLAQIHCFRSDTNQSCCVLSNGLKYSGVTGIEDEGGQRVWRKLRFGDPFEQGALKMSVMGRVILSHWSYAPPGGNAVTEYTSFNDKSAGIFFDLCLNFGDEPSFKVKLWVYAAEAYNDWDDSLDGVSRFTLMDTLSGWM